MAREEMAISLEGVDELIKNLESVSNDVAADLARCIRKGGKIVLDAAKDNIKSHKLIKSGDLLDNMSMNTTEKDRTQVEVTIGPGKKQFYGMFHEYGTSKMKARPFLRPAYDENIEKVQEVIAEELRKIIERRSHK